MSVSMGEKILSTTELGQLMTAYNVAHRQECKPNRPALENKLTKCKDLWLSYPG